MENLSMQSGVYVILNIIDCKVYIGQAKNFNNRDHFQQLENGNDNNRKLQYDYDNGKEFVYFIAANTNWKVERNDKELASYEKIYMILYENLGYELYNRKVPNINEKNKLLKRLSEEEYNEAVETIEKDFSERFGKKTTEILSLSVDEREKLLENYVYKRVRHENEKSDRFFFNRNRIQNILGMKRSNVESLNLDEFFFSKAGNYLSEGIDQIIYDKNKVIQSNQYCLWAFAGNAVDAGLVRSLCRERAKKNIDTYVLFSITPSSKYASSEPNKYSILNRKKNNDLLEGEVAFLNLYNVNNNDYAVPEKVACTAKSAKNANAFVIDDISFIGENMDIKENELARTYSAVKVGGLYNYTDRRRCSTFYLRSDKERYSNKELFEVSERRSFCFLGKLAAPYVIKLNRE